MIETTLEAFIAQGHGREEAEEMFDEALATFRDLIDEGYSLGELEEWWQDEYGLEPDYLMELLTIIELEDQK